MIYQIPQIPFLKLKFIFSSEQDALLPIHKGSMLRGAFGHALKSTVCVMDSGQSCEKCMLRAQCVYTRIFETYIEDKPPPFLKGLNTSPRPYVIDAYQSSQSYRTGDLLEFYVTLFGKVCELHPYVIFAFMRAGERGFARSRFQFRLERVNWIDNEPVLLYDGKSQSLVSMAKPTVVSENGQLPVPATLKFLTPVRLKFQNRLTMDFTFRMLVFKMLRRALEIAHFHVPDARPDWEFRPFLETASKVDIVDKRLYWEDVTRYSNKQAAKLQMGGIFGEIVLDGELGPFTRLLRISEVLHVGKGAVFGLGKVKVVGENK
jgi:hypothetical protein